MSPTSLDLLADHHEVFDLSNTGYKLLLFGVGVASALVSVGEDLHDHAQVHVVEPFFVPLGRLDPGISLHSCDLLLVLQNVALYQVPVL